MNIERVEPRYMIRPPAPGRSAWWGWYETASGAAIAVCSEDEARLHHLMVRIRSDGAFREVISRHAAQTGWTAAHGCSVRTLAWPEEDA